MQNVSLPLSSLPFHPVLHKSIARSVLHVQVMNAFVLNV